MSEHRRPCMSEPPTLVAWGLDGHEHACIHDAEPDYGAPHTIEHKCDCGMTWRERRPGTFPEPVPNASQAGQEAGT